MSTAVRRRDFLISTVAAPAIGPVFAARGPRVIGANDTVRVGVIGAGKRGQGLMIAAGFAQPDQLRASQRLGTDGQSPLGIRITGICDVYDAHAEWGLRAAGSGARRYRQYPELLASREVDAVVIATPDHWHAPMVMAAARAGKHVYVEKCFTHNIPETFEAVRAVKENKIVLQLGHQRRASSLYASARDTVAKGSLGSVNLIHTFSNRNTPNGAWVYAIPPDAGPHNIEWAQFLGPAPKRPFDSDRFFRWRKYWDYGTGLSGDLFSHEWDGVDLVMGGIGLPATAVASGGIYFWKEKREVPDVLQIAYEYPERGFTLVYNATQASSHPRRGPLYMGSDATMDLSDGIQVFADRDSERHREKIQKGEITSDRPIISLSAGVGGNQSFVQSTNRAGQSVDVTYLHLKNWLEAIRNDRPAACHEDIALREAITTHMGVLSYKWGCRVRWDAKTQQAVPDTSKS